jgi:hypothetical protein
MSVENNSARSIDGLNTLFCDVINVVESIEIDGDNGNNNQLLTSDGTRTLWRDLSSLLAPLSVSLPISYVTGTTYDGSVARTIQIADGAIGNIKLENSTISGVSLGGTLFNLTFGNGISAIDNMASPATLYNGSELIGLSIEPKSGGGITVDADGVSLTNDTISGIQLGNNLNTLTISQNGTIVDTYNGSVIKTIDLEGKYIAGCGIDISGHPIPHIEADTDEVTITHNLLGAEQLSVLKVPNTLTLTSPLSFTSGTEYDGSASRTIQITNIPNSALQNSTISGISLGSNLNNLTAGTGLEYDTGTTYNGGTAKAIHLKPEYQTISDRISYEDTGVGSERWLYTITATEWRPNDDSTLYNIHIEDDSTTTLGRAKIATTSLEAIAIIHIPYDWTPANIFIDCRGSTGLNISRTYYLYKIRNWGGTGSTYLGSYTTNSETAIDYAGTTYGAGESGYSLMIKMILTATTDHLGGGYITLTAPTGDDY